MELSQTIAIVTGGASGLGEATTRRIVEAGGKVAIFDLNVERGNALVRELGNDSVVYFQTNVADALQVEQHVAKVVEHFGQVNVLVSCAGIATPGKVVLQKGPLALSQFEQVIQVNLVGTFNVLRVVAQCMQQNEPNEEGERGVIINTASVAAFEGQIGQAAYSASKAGVVGMTLPIAREFARDGIRVMAIAPGLFETPLLDGLSEPARVAIASSVPFPNRLGKASEYALLVESIVRNSFLNGEVIRLDGAIRMQPR
ncbi:SDR family NAD(P)-dependent oxidoreductase [Paenisporosarcina indica]|uniref:SDR family NAD(P)-dependent oxidoreductase n=1 Tax=Paenisporosarcina indica TaxID=650093 RepID=UPI00095005FD|nr:SDR family NAD(P)-dependent oxidoreductase [Paenisporosarcina indica]